MSTGNPPADTVVATPGATRGGRRRFLLVFNPTAGMSRPGQLERVRAALVVRGAEVIDAAAPTPEAASARIITAIERDAVDAVLAAGGDGTIRRVGAVAGPRGVPVGIIPLGTGNVMAHEIGMPTAPAELARVLMDGPVARIRGGMANGEPFFLWAGTGLDGRIVAALEHGWKRRLGKLAYGQAIARVLRARPDTLEVVIDGERHSAAWAIVTNASRYGGNFVLTLDTRITDPGLVALLFRAEDRGALVGALTAIALGRLPRLEAKGALRVARVGRSVHVGSREPVPVQVDGDAFGASPLEITGDGPELQLIVPPPRP